MLTIFHWVHFIRENLVRTLTLFRMGGGDKRLPPTGFSPVTSTNAGTSPINFPTFSFNPFDRLV